MVCEQILGKLQDFDTSKRSIEYVDIEWHEAFKNIKKSQTKERKLVFVWMILF